MHTRRRALVSLGTVVVLGSAGCTDLRALGEIGEQDDPFEPAVTPEPLPADAPLPPGIVSTDEPPYVEIVDHRAVSEAHAEYLDDYPAFRVDETVTTTSYLDGAEVVGWNARGDAENVHTTRRETTVTDAAYLKIQRYEYTEWPFETMYPQQALARYVDYTEYFAVDAHVMRIDGDYEPLGVEAGDTDDRTTRYTGWPDEAEREFREEMRTLRDPRFGLSADGREIERVEGGTKLKTYEARLAPEEDEQHDHPDTDRHRFNYWLFDDAGYVRERRTMTVVPQDRERLAFSASVETRRWEPLAESPGPLRPDWVDEARGWEYPDEWWDEYDGPRDE